MKASLCLLCLFLAKSGCGADQLRKAAVLILPDSIECRIGAARSLSGEIAIRWDESEPVKISLWRDFELGKGDRLLARISVFDEDGREMEQQYFVSIPPMPDGTVIVGKAEYRKFRVFVWNGAVVFPRPGNYYAIATFEDAWMGELNVQFTTPKRWFRVVESPSKPKNT
jgi:hypothetical protein